MNAVTCMQMHKLKVTLMINVIFKLKVIFVYKKKSRILLLLFYSIIWLTILWLIIIMIIIIILHESMVLLSHWTLFCWVAFLSNDLLCGTWPWTLKLKLQNLRRDLKSSNVNSQYSFFSFFFFLPWSLEVKKRSSFSQLEPAFTKESQTSLV